MLSIIKSKKGIAFLLMYLLVGVSLFSKNTIPPEFIVFATTYILGQSWIDSKKAV